MFSIIYDDLRLRARATLRKEKSHRSLDTTELVNEAYLRLVRCNVSWQDRFHFYVVAGRAMRRILVEEARKRNALKRGKGQIPISIDQIYDIEDKISSLETSCEEIEALDKALLDLEKGNRRLCWVVELRYFVGLSEDQTAEILDVSRGTVSKDWQYAKALLSAMMKRDFEYVG